MSIGSIKDTSIVIKPSKQFIDFIKTLNDVESMPENVLKILKVYTNTEQLEKKIVNDSIPNEKYTNTEIQLLKELNETTDFNEEIKAKLSNLIDETPDSDSDYEELDQKDPKSMSKTQTKKLKEQQKQKIKSSLTLNLNDIKWLNVQLKEKRSKDETFKVYLHELIEESQLVLPKNEIIERNPELEARCQKLKMQQDARMYRNMTRNVDSTKRYHAEDTIAFQSNSHFCFYFIKIVNFLNFFVVTVKQINRQLIAVLQFIFSVLAGFAFGFIGVELIVGDLDFGFRLLLGIMCALVIALAEIYFLAKRLNEEYDMALEEPKLIEGGEKNIANGGSSIAKGNTKEHTD